MSNTIQMKWGPPGTATTTRRPASRSARKALSLAGAPDRYQGRRGRLPVVGKVLKKDQYAFGYDAQSGECVSVAPEWTTGRAARQS